MWLSLRRSRAQRCRRCGDSR
ncbi:hypothetical protein SM139_2610, partial [Stenotrophomonas maltophilia]